MTAARRGHGRWLARLASLPRPLLLALIAALALTVVYGELPARPALLHVLEKLGHPGVFGAEGLLALALAYRSAARAPPWRGYALALGTCALLGAATELAQNITHRSPSLTDVGLDLEGALCALAVAFAVDERIVGARARLGRALSWGVAAALGAVISAPLLFALAAYANRALTFPVLFTPRTALDLYFVQPGHQVISMQSASDAPNRRVLRVQLRDFPFAGIALSEPSADWRMRRALRVDVANPSAAQLTFNVRVDDTHGSKEFADRYNGAFLLAPRSRRAIVIPLATVAAGPQYRTLDLSTIARVVLFRSGDGSDEFDLESVALE